MVKLKVTGKTEKRVTFEIYLSDKDKLETYRHDGFRLKIGVVAKWDPPNKVVYVSRAFSDTVTVSASNFVKIQKMVEAYNSGAESSPGRGGSTKESVAKKAKKVVAKKSVAKKAKKAKKVVAKKSVAKKKVVKKKAKKVVAKKVVAKKSVAKKKVGKKISINGAYITLMHENKLLKAQVEKHVEIKDMPVKRLIAELNSIGLKVTSK